VDLPFLTHLRRFSGLRIRPVGVPAPYGAGEAAGVTVAFEIGVSADDLNTTRGRLRLPGRQLFAAPSWLPPGTDVHTLERSARVLLSAPEASQAELRNTAARLARAAEMTDIDHILDELGPAA